MVRLKFEKYSVSPNTWWIETLSDGRKVIVTRCGRGHIGSLGNHEISADGTVSPSVVCQHEGCDYHEFIQLDGWAHPELH